MGLLQVHRRHSHQGIETGWDEHGGSGLLTSGPGTWAAITPGTSCSAGGRSSS